MAKNNNKFKASDLDTPYTLKDEEPFVRKITNKLSFVVTQNQKQFKFYGRITNEHGEVKLKKRVLGVYETKLPSKKYPYLTIQEAKKMAIDFEGGLISKEITTIKDAEFLKGDEWLKKNFKKNICDFLEDKRKNLKSFENVSWYIQHLERSVIKIKKGNCLTKDITSDDWAEIRVLFGSGKLMHRKDGYSQATQNAFHTQSKSFFNWCIQNGLINSNPIIFNKPFKIKKVQNIFYERDEVLNIIDACNQLSFPYKYVPQIQLLIVRRQETVINMEWNDILWKEKLFKSRMEIEKKEQSNLNVPLSDKALELLKEIKDYQKKNSINSKYIFPCPDNLDRPIHPRHQRRRFSRKIKALTGIKHYEATHLRHTSRTWMSRLKIRPEVVSFIGGWSKYGGADHNVHYNSDDYSLGGESHEAVNKLAGVFYSSDEVTVPSFQEKDESAYVQSQLENMLLSHPENFRKAKGDVYKDMEDFNKRNNLTLTPELEKYIECLFTYQWTRASEDLQNLKSALTNEVKNRLTKNFFMKVLLEKYYQALEDNLSKRQRRLELREVLPKLNQFMFLKHCLEKYNKEKSNPSEPYMTIENIKQEYALLRVDFLKDIEKNILN
ncbi:MAG: tyrosine-type recombinase/integrase, partial [Hyphomicrobiales bacterium]|nr:tyrosine-type recombinase/integrase [Hyphomicrobiales bacterium]